MENADRLRQVEFERYEAMTFVLWPKARDGDVPAVRALVAAQGAALHTLRPGRPDADRVTDADSGPVTFIHKCISEPREGDSRPLSNTRPPRPPPAVCQADRRRVTNSRTRASPRMPSCQEQARGL